MSRSMTRLVDQHLHSRHSMDSRTEPEANVESALSRGLRGLTFTEHFDTHPNDWPGCIYDDAAYSDTIAGLRLRYGERIFIGKGIEVCYQPARMDFLIDFLSRHRFDVVLLSVHYFGSEAVHRREHWDGVTAEEGTRRYLETVREAVRGCVELRHSHGRMFDVLGHLDLVKRYTRRFFDTYDVTMCADLIDDILRACVEAALVPEINTSSLRQGLSETMPGSTTVRRYAELGGTAMSVGSDAHRAEDVGAGLDKAAAMLRDAGIPRVAWFREREQVDIPLF